MRCIAFALLFVGLCGGATYAQTPSGWLIHDLDRPQPPVVKPAKLASPVPAPSDAEVLFDGTSLDSWRAVDGDSPKWVIRDGYMESVPDSGKLISAKGFGDVQLHLEWAVSVKTTGKGQERGNSGVFLMGKYEVQILDSFNNPTYPDGQAAAVYGQYPPLVNASLPPGEWQSYDILFRRPRFDHHGKLIQPAKLDVIHNGVWVQVSREAWGATSWLMNFPYEAHSERLPIALQDHGNPVRFRNIWIRELPETETPGPNIVRTPAAVAPNQLVKLVGDYLMLDETLYQVSMDSERLLFHAPGRVPLELVPADENTFYLRHTAGHVVFRRNAEGLGTQLQFYLGGKEYCARAVSTSLQQEKTPAVGQTHQQAVAPAAN